MNLVWLTVILPMSLGAILIAVEAVVKRLILKGGNIHVGSFGIEIKGGMVSSLQVAILSFVSATLLFGLVYILAWGLTLPPILPKYWLAVLCGTAANSIIQFLNIKALSLDKGEVSLTQPLQAMTPGLISGLALLLGEYPSKVGCAGIGLMILGSYVLTWEKAPEYWYDYLGPIKRLRLLWNLTKVGLNDQTPEQRAEMNKSIVVSLALGSAAMGTIGLLFDGLFVRRGINLQGMVLGQMTMTAILSLTYLIIYHWHPDANEEQKQNFRNCLYGGQVMIYTGLIGTIFVARMILMQPVFNKAFVSYVGTLKRISILASVILGGQLLKEEEFKKRFWAAILIILGVILISMDGLPARLSTKIEYLGF
ncbi:MAG: hypothetical protein A3I89_01985 [Candidatus Harrisonbacteria bacterium RIFCSPLOWO2_02_FULL_41_11]|uniref:EamA domain-containing protein n=1 Tax=Candidatus Harrisonbacteria bacterium RIFCSPHIGHO2_02_FULL_42_16 TaxID=1798404 RepID=A0A1G1ZGA3_9BACT|nr:MAG: hypothetical protein A3B92_01785 [Candidatus Harrisonbacteria bacterium RIFCSPHIGHO2_02_FULL_42_16]OGY65630.1 MAG: hypothetical protein A3I89_01985 [Candidatus Harrisonbacteria bacterium RIFCSPLOWO2_02_FULL_41_11]